MNLKSLSKTLLILALPLLLAACPDPDQQFSQQQPSWHLNDFIPFVPPSSIWGSMAENFALQDNANHHAVKYEIAWFSQQHAYIKELTHNAQPYLYYVYQQTQKRNIPAEIALLPMVESDYNPFVFSNRGATGLWQMMPGTASGFGLKINWWYDGRRDITASTNAALNYLQYLHKQFGNWLLAIAAYNSGEGTIRNAIRKNERQHKPTDFWHLTLPKQTESYVPKILALAAIIKNPQNYLVKLQPVPNQPFFAPVKMSGQINLTQVAYLANTKVSNIRLLNPGFRRWATNPSDSYSLLLPKSKVNTFNANLNNTPRKMQQVTWLHHQVKSGDSLYALAKQFHTKPIIIKRANNLKKSTLKINQNLFIPLSAKHVASKIPITSNNPKASIAEDELPGPRHVNHTVSKNDNLWTIAKHYHVTPDQIRYWNNMDYHQSLKVNQTLVLWLPSHHRFARPSLKHTVKSGESLFSIAQHYHTTETKIIAWNHITNPGLIRIGDTLYIHRS
jgi:membrane-bound lytic murein transglycosylase D